MRLFFFLLAFPALAAQAAVHFDIRPGALAPVSAKTPIVLVLGYRDCLHLCSTVAEGVEEALRRAGLRADADYTPMFASIDPRETGARPFHGWKVLTGNTASSMAEAVGFQYEYEKASGEFEHPAGFVVLTPGGRVSRYFEGVRFDPAEVRKALRFAAAGETPGLLERVALVCFHDPVSGKYDRIVLAVLKLLLALFVASLGIYLWRHR